jgi:hypothetical protein
MELLSKRNLALTAAALAATGAMASCARPGTEPGNNPGVAATAEAAPSIDVEPFASDAHEGSSAPDIDEQDSGSLEKPRDPLVFVVGQKAGETALFGCKREDTTHLITFGRDYVEGAVKGGTSVTADGAKAIPNTTASKLQADANAHSGQLVTGSQTVGESTINCGGPLPDGAQIFDLSGDTITVDDLQDYQVVVGDINGDSFTAVDSHA